MAAREIFASFVVVTSALRIAIGKIAARLHETLAVHAVRLLTRVAS